LEDLANPKIELNLVPNPVVPERQAVKKPLQILKVFGGLPKKNLKYEILKKPILVFSQTDVTSNKTENRNYESNKIYLEVTHKLFINFL
jgi:hypothetical protein